MTKISRLILCAAVLITTNGLLVGCQQTETKTVAITTRGEANKTATNAPGDTSKGLENFWEAIQKSNTLKSLILHTSVKPGSDSLVVRVSNAYWAKLDRTAKMEIVEGIQSIWASSNAPVDPKKCPIIVVNEQEAVLAESSLPDGAEVSLK